jgi:hypothetical protein
MSKNDDTEPKTLSVPEWGELFLNLGRDASYNAAKRGEIPTIRVGRKLRAPVSAGEKMLEAAANKFVSSKIGKEAA